MSEADADTPEQVLALLASSDAADISRGLEHANRFRARFPRANAKGHYAGYALAPTLTGDSDDTKRLTHELAEQDCLVLFELQCHEQSLRAACDLIALSRRLVVADTAIQLQFVEVICKYYSIYEDRHLPAESAPVHDWLDEILPRLCPPLLGRLLSWAVEAGFASDFGLLLGSYLERTPEQDAEAVLTRWIDAIHETGYAWIAARALAHALPERTRERLRRTTE